MTVKFPIILFLCSAGLIFSSPNAWAHHDPQFPPAGEQCDDDDGNTEDPEDPSDPSTCNLECNSYMIKGYMEPNTVCCYTGWVINSGDTHSKRPQWDAHRPREKLIGDPQMFFPTNDFYDNYDGERYGNNAGLPRPFEDEYGRLRNPYGQPYSDGVTCKFYPTTQENMGGFNVDPNAGSDSLSFGGCGVSYLAMRCEATTAVDGGAPYYTMRANDSIRNSFDYDKDHRFTVNEQENYSSPDFTTVFGNVFGQCCAIGENCCGQDAPSRPVLVPRN